MIEREPTDAWALERQGHASKGLHPSSLIAGHFSVAREEVARCQIRLVWVVMPPSWTSPSNAFNEVLERVHELVLACKRIGSAAMDLAGHRQHAVGIFAAPAVGMKAVAVKLCRLSEAFSDAATVALR